MHGFQPLLFVSLSPTISKNPRRFTSLFYSDRQCIPGAAGGSSTTSTYAPTSTPAPGSGKVKFGGVSELNYDMRTQFEGT